MADTNKGGGNTNFSISDLILNQMRNAGAPRTTTSTTNSNTTETASKQPIDLGQLGLMLALILGGQNKGTIGLDTIATPANPPGYGLQGISSPVALPTSAVAPNLSIPDASPIGANALPLINKTDPIALLAYLLKMSGQQG